MASTDTSANSSPEKGEEAAVTQGAILTVNDQWLLATIQLFSNGPWKELQDPLEKVEKFKQCHQMDRDKYTKKHKELYKIKRDAFLKARCSQGRDNQGRMRLGQNIDGDSSQLDSQMEVSILNETSELTKRRRVRVRKFEI